MDIFLSKFLFIATSDNLVDSAIPEEKGETTTCSTSDESDGDSQLDYHARLLLNGLLEDILFEIGVDVR